MRSLLIRFFLSFWLIIGITVGIAAIVGFRYAENIRETIENFESGEVIREAGRALDEEGRSGLVRWLEGLPDSDGIRVFILDEHGHDILDRRVPFPAARMFDRHRYHFHDNERRHDDPRSLRRARHLPQLVAANGDVYTLTIAPTRSPFGFWTRVDTHVFLVALMIVISGTVSWLLAAAISRPVRRLRETTQSLAGGDLEARVTDSVSGRRDELGLLGQDFNAMAQQLQRTAERQRELTRNISHELRSPLARMRVALELARRETGDRDEFERIDLEAERLDELIGQILSYSRLETGTGEEPVVIDLAEVVRDVADDVSYECKADGINDVRVMTRIDSSPAVRCHVAAMTSAIENVVRNAVHHSPTGGTVTVTLHQDVGSAVVEILDEGAGVAAEELAYLFEPFFRATTVSGTDRSGAGLGLAIARRAVQLHGGEITAANKDDGGLRVTIRLPIAST